jgi:hypothetical protein
MMHSVEYYWDGKAIKYIVDQRIIPRIGEFICVGDYLYRVTSIMHMIDSGIIRVVVGHCGQVAPKTEALGVKSAEGGGS